MRKHRWVKQNSLHKYPITDIDQTCRILSDSGWIEREITDIEIALSVLTKQELKNIAKERHINIQEEKNPVNTQCWLIVKRLINIKEKKRL
jgi:Fanconi-associated nuclease 1